MSSRPGSLCESGAPVRVAVAGLGRSGVYFHCRPLRALEGFELAAVADSRLDVAQSVAEAHQCDAHGDFRELLDRPDIDLVVIATPTRLHMSMAMEAIRANKHVLVEKPFASSSADAREMFAAGKRAGRFVGAFHNRRFDADVLAIRDVVASGILGPILHTSIRLHSYTRRKDWQTLRSQGGGALSNWGAHVLDWCMFLFGPHIRILHAHLMHAINPGDAEDSFHLLISTPDHGLVTVEYFNCAARGLPRWHVVGQTGTVVCDVRQLTTRHCDPARLVPLTAEVGASDGTYGIREDLGWVESERPVEYQDDARLFYEALRAHWLGERLQPVTSDEVIQLIEVLEQLKEQPVRCLDRFPAARRTEPKPQALAV